MKNLTTDELVTALRNDQTCDDCIWAAEFNNDTRLLYDAAADMLENHASDRAALVAEIENLRMALASACKERDEMKKELAAMRNELCCKCGNYLEAHNGACDGCRWEKR